MAGASYQKIADLAGRVCRMGNPGQVLMSDGQWALDVFLPHRPHATNYLDQGQYRMSREDALTMRYVEHSPHALLGSLVVDCDHPDAAMRAFEKPSDHPAPNWVAQSPGNGGAVSARAQQRREVTARELAARLGSSERTARRLVAEPRDEFLSRAAAKRKMAVELREQGHTYSEIATTMGLSIGSVGKLLHDARKHAATKQGQASA